MDALQLIDMYDYDEALFYCDPPYTHASRVRTAHYLFEMNTAAHVQLAEKLRDIKGMAVVSGYKSSLYKDLYDAHGWQRKDRLARTNGADKVECIWLCPRTQEELSKENAQLRLL